MSVSSAVRETRQDTTRHWLGVIALTILTFLASWFAFRMARFGGVAALWVVNGLHTGALLLTDKRRWSAYFVGSWVGQVTARALVGDGMPLLLWLPIVNLFESGVVAFWVRRRVEDLRKARSLGEVARDATASTVVACLLSATLALPALLTRPDSTPLIAWGTWFTAHLLGMVVMATLTVCAFQQGVHLFGRPGRRLDFALCFLLLVGICALAFGQSTYSLLFLVFLPLLLASFRHGLSGMVLGVIVVAGLSGITAARGIGSFAMVGEASPLARLLYWQVYIAAGCLLAYSTAVAMTQRRQMESRLAASQAQLKSITDHIPAMVSHFDRDGRYVYANPRSREMFPGVELIGKTLAEVRPDRSDTLSPTVAAALRGEAQEYDVRLELAGRQRDLNVQFVPELGPDGSVLGFYSLAFDITAQKDAERALERLARFDALTGLANRRHFEESLHDAVALAQRTAAPLMLVSLDLDKFKQINDTLGHAAGDEVLKEFGRRVQASVYDVDLVARLGGDEFVVLVQYSANAEAGERLARKIVEAMATPMTLPTGQVVPAATSIGIGLQQPVRSAEALLELADKALYEAKRAGRNTWHLLQE
jgi:diguanylate cyclase (GGDEF)-like protein/PAS domain S-box-containing protein